LKKLHKQVVQIKNLAIEIYEQMDIENEFEIKENKFLQLFTEDFLKQVAQINYVGLNVEESFKALAKYPVDRNNELT